jgi:hypothetical protein
MVGNPYLGFTFGLLVIRLQKRATFFCPMLPMLSKLGTGVLGPASVKLISLSGAPTGAHHDFAPLGLEWNLGPKLGPTNRSFLAQNEG